MRLTIIVLVILGFLALSKGVSHENENDKNENLAAFDDTIKIRKVRTAEGDKNKIRKKIIRRNNMYKKRLIKGQNKKRENKFKNKKGKRKTKQSWKNGGGKKANGRNKKSRSR